MKSKGPVHDRAPLWYFVYGYEDMTKPNTPFRRNPAGLWQGYCSVIGTGASHREGWKPTPRRRVSRAELREAYRLWYTHADVRTGNVRP